MSPKIIFTLFFCLLLFPQPLLAEEITPAIDPHSVNLSMVSLPEGGGDYYSPVAGLGLHLALFNRWSVGAEAFYQEEGVQNHHLYLCYRLRDPLDKEVWTSFQVGVSELFYLDLGDEYRGFHVGANMIRFFQERWSAYTNLKISIFPGMLIPSYEIGFNYFFTSSWSLDLTYRGFDLNRHGLTIGTSFYR